MIVAPFEFRASSADRPDELPDEGWLPAVVPGGVHESLIAAGDLADPYLEENEEAAAWVEDEVWWYRTSFARPAMAVGEDRARLVFHGLDTVCTVFLNGDPVLKRSNMFCPGEIDLTGRLEDQNVVHVRFDPPLRDLVPPATTEPDTDAVAAAAAVVPVDADASSTAPASPAAHRSALQRIRTLRRKATYSWGWDFAPRLPSVGLWQPVELIVERRAALRGHRLRTTWIGEPHADGRADARVLVAVEAEGFALDQKLTASVVITAPDGATASGSQPLPLATEGSDPALLTAETELRIEAAELWWTHDLGRQPLYRVDITLFDAGGGMLDRRTDTIGIRTIALDRSPDPADPDANLFRFVLNGFPIFARGANWVPASMLPGSIRPETYDTLIRRAVAGGMNMLRIWGGGFYEHDRFYEMCDGLGVLVWQDFMFACYDYPSDDARLAAEVEEEAAFQVRRLRNHPCLALWCGNNEVQAIHAMAQGNTDPGNWGHSFFHDLLPRVVETQDPGAVYWPGSPWSDRGAAEVNGVRDGDRHAWEVWHGLNLGAGGPTTFASRGEAVHFGRYAHDTGRFISEFGIHAAPELATLERWTRPGSLALHSPAFDHRNKDNPKNKGDALMDFETGLPTSLAEYVELSMACQAEGLKFGIEHYRRRQPGTSGTLVWQFNDPWPGITWSILDYEGVPKAAYFAVARAYAPVLASFDQSGDGTLELWLSNSSRTKVEGELKVEVVTYSGATVWDETLTVAALPGTSSRVWSAEPHQVGPGPDRVAWVSSPGGLVEANRMFFGRLKEQDFGPHHVERMALTDRRESGGPVELELTSHGYNYFTRVEAPYPGVWMDRNYFDLRPGETATVSIDGLPSGIDAAGLRVTSYQGPGRTDGGSNP